VSGERRGSGNGAVLPNFLIIGAARAGTTSMATWLHAHPQVFMPPRKELFFFDREQRWSHGVSWYRSQFEGAGDRPAIGEATTSYMFYEHVPPRMAEVVPDARLIAILRNPVDRAYSHYCFARGWGVEHRSFAQAIDDERDGRILVPGGEYLGRGRYLSQLERVGRHFPASALLVLLFDDLRDAPAGAYATVCRFIGIDDDFVPEHLGTVVNASHELRWKWLWRLTRRYRTNYRPHDALSARLDRRNAIRYPPLDAGLRSELLAEFTRDNRALATWLGRDLARWSS
jgi:hypothetical protein